MDDRDCPLLLLVTTGFQDKRPLHGLSMTQIFPYERPFLILSLPVARIARVPIEPGEK